MSTVHLTNQRLLEVNDAIAYLNRTNEDGTRPYQFEPTARLGFIRRIAVLKEAAESLIKVRDELLAEHGIKDAVGKPQNELTDAQRSGLRAFNDAWTVVLNGEACELKMIPYAWLNLEKNDIPFEKVVSLLPVIDGFPAE